VAVATLALLASRDKNDGQGLGILGACYCNVLVQYSVSTAYRLRVGSRMCTLQRKYQSMIAQQSSPRELSEWRFRVREGSHVYQLKSLVCGTFTHSAQCSTFLDQMHRNAILLYTQSLAKAVITFYSVKTMNSAAEVE